MNHTASVMPASRWNTPKLSGHSVQFYEDEAFLLDGLSLFIGAALAAGDSAVVITSQALREGLHERLSSSGLDLRIPTEQGRFASWDAAETLSRFMVDGVPDSTLFKQVVGGVISGLAGSARGRNRRVAVFGSMVAILYEQGKCEAAIQLEQIWNELAETHAFQLHCAYPLSLFSESDDGQRMEQICAEHSHVTPAERYTLLQNDEERLRTIAVLQQRAQALEAQIREHEKVQTSLQKLAAIVESSDDAIASKDLNGIVKSWNKSAERLFGYKEHEIIGRPITLIIPPELQADETMILGKIRRGEKIDHFETVRVHKNGKRIDVSLTVSPLKDEQGKVIGAAKIIRDVTESKKIEQALRTTEKLAAAGRLAATVAHEINNPLEAVTNLIYLAKRDLANTAKVAGYLELAGRELDRVAHIARQTLGFYRDNSSPMPVDPTETLDDLLTLYEKRLASRNIRVVKQYDKDVQVTALAGELRQAFSNIITNAIDAMPAGGALVIRVSKAHEWSNGHHPGVRVTVLDTGCGIQRQHRDNLFQPFFTTKKDVGTGLGLWITRNIVEKHHGNIRMKSRTGPNVHGTAFSIFLPVNCKIATPESNSLADESRSDKISAGAA